MQIVAVIPKYTKEQCFTAIDWQRLQSLGQFTWCDTSTWKNPENLPANSPKTSPESPLHHAISQAHVLITGWGTPAISAHAICHAPHLRLIAHAAGSVAFVASDAWDRQIQVSNVMPIMAWGVAEFTLLCILSGLRRFDALIAPQKYASANGDPPPFYNIPKVGFMLRGKTIGLLGMGIIAREVAALLQPFGCTIIAHDPHLPPSAAASLGVQLCPLADLFSKSHAVSLHAPGIELNKHIVNRPMLEKLQPGAILINTARGILLDHAALAEIAARGKIAAYLDTTTPEPLPPDHPLRRLPNVTITPHIAGPTVEGWPMMGSACVDEVQRFLRSEPLKYPVTREQLAWQSTS